MLSTEEGQWINVLKDEKVRGLEEPQRRFVDVVTGVCCPSTGLIELF